MSGETTVRRTECFDCGFEAPADSDEWESTTHPTLGAMARCPECGSTDVHDRR